MPSLGITTIGCFSNTTPCGISMQIFLPFKNGTYLYAPQIASWISKLIFNKISNGEPLTPLLYSKPSIVYFGSSLITSITSVLYLLLSSNDFGIS